MARRLTVAMMVRIFFMIGKNLLWFLFHLTRAITAYSHAFNCRENIFRPVPQMD